MKITINAEERLFPDDVLTITGVLESLGIKSENALVLLNGEAPERDALDSTSLKDGDSLDILRFAGGG